MAKLSPHVDGDPIPEGTTVIGFDNTIDVMLTIGILRGDYMAFDAMLTTFYALDQDQLQRARQQLQQQTIYQGWITAGYLVEATLAPPPPPEDAPP
jgi:hypothetical protein